MLVQAHLHWKIWKERNNKLFEGKESKATQILKLAIIRVIENIKSNGVKIQEGNSFINKIKKII